MFMFWPFNYIDERVLYIVWIYNYRYLCIINYCFISHHHISFPVNIVYKEEVERSLVQGKNINVEWHYGMAHVRWSHSMSRRCRFVIFGLTNTILFVTVVSVNQAIIFSFFFSLIWAHYPHPPPPSSPFSSTQNYCLLPGRDRRSEWNIILLLEIYVDWARHIQFLKYIYFTSSV